jgi:hypothetical protein
MVLGIVTLKNVTIMKKINSFILFGAAVFTFAACSVDSQEEFTPKNNKPVYETLSVKVGTEPTTRVSLATDATAATFETGDNIAVWTEAGSFQVCPVDATGKISVDISGGARSNYAVYYPGATAPTFDGSALTITLPDTYDYADVSGDKNPVPMVAKNVGGDAADMTFYAVCGLARISLSGIPATADKLEVLFNGKKVTGDFTVTNPGTNSPSITMGSAFPATPVTINLTPGTDYTGAVINIPVPVVSSGTVSAQITAKNGDNQIVFPNATASYTPARAKGKKLTVALTPTIYSMTFTKGNLYTDGGTLKIASDWYSNIYNDNSETYVNTTYSASNRSHFNFNETAAMMNNLPGSYDVAPDAGTFDWATASTNVGSFENKYVIISAQSYRVPTQAEWAAVTTGSRPGATLNATITSTSSSSSTSGWKAIKAVVSGMGTAGTSNPDGTAFEASSDYQAGLLIFPDNVVIDGTFVTLGDKDEITGHNNATTLTMDKLNELITAGCAFLPEVGRHNSGSFGFVGQLGTYWSSTQYDTDAGYYLHFQENSFQNDINYSKQAFRSVRLVKK